MLSGTGRDRKKRGWLLFPCPARKMCLADLKMLIGIEWGVKACGGTHGPSHLEKSKSIQQEDRGNLYFHQE